MCACASRVCIYKKRSLKKFFVKSLRFTVAGLRVVVAFEPLCDRV
jgi:hypothetical protein